MKLNKDGLDLLVDYFASLDDPRIDRTKKYNMRPLHKLCKSGDGSHFLSGRT